MRLTEETHDDAPAVIVHLEGMRPIEELNTPKPHRISRPLSPGGESVREGFPV